MDLASKLRRFMPQQNNLNVKIENLGTDLDPFLQGQEVATPYGTCYVVETKHPLTKKHGHWALGKVLGADYNKLSLLGQGFQGSFDAQQTLFFDTETTGLAGGTGTYAFLVGLGFFTEDHFVVKQLLMRDYNEELALLYLLDQEFGQRKIILSFNGKTFDLPLLQTRFTLSRFNLEWIAQVEHLDLLHMARRIWRHKLPSCSLNSLEEHILGVTRVDDISGFEIPARYFQFLQTKQGELLQQIVEHNYLDIVSLATLLFRLQATLELEPAECDCSYEAEALANLALLAGDYNSALPFLEAARQLATETEQYLGILRTTASVHKRLGDYGEASKFWKKILELNEADFFAAEELAKYYEHRLKDLLGAEQVTRRALALAWQSRSPRASALEHRLKRIETKVKKVD